MPTKLNDWLHAGVQYKGQDTDEIFTIMDMIDGVLVIQRPDGDVIKVALKMIEVALYLYYKNGEKWK